MANVNMILDEAASLGPNMNCLEDAIDKYRGYGIRLQLYYQSPAQLKKCFPDEQDQTVLANVTQIFFGVNDTSAEYISNRLGDATITVDSGGSGMSHTRPTASMGQENASDSTNTNSNWSQMARKLLKPEEILTLNERIAITFVPGIPPIATILERYYERRGNAKRSNALRMFSESLCFLVITTLCFWATFSFVESLSHVGSF